MELGAIARRVQSKKDADAAKVEKDVVDDGAKNGDGGGDGGIGGTIPGREGKMKATPRTAPATPRRDLSSLPFSNSASSVSSSAHRGLYPPSSRYPSHIPTTSHGPEFPSGYQMEGGAVDEL